MEEKREKKTTKQFFIFSITNIKMTTWCVVRVGTHNHQYISYERIFIEKE
jgi:hypothetical protein